MVTGRGGLQDVHTHAYSTCTHGYSGHGGRGEHASRTQTRRLSNADGTGGHICLLQQKKSWLHLCSRMVRVTTLDWRARVAY